MPSTEQTDAYGGREGSVGNRESVRPTFAAVQHGAAGGHSIVPVLDASNAAPSTAADTCATVTAVACAAVGATATIVLGGWALDLPSLTRLHPTFASMKVTTALCLQALAASLWLQSRPATGRRLLGARLLAILPAALAAASLAEDLSGIGVGIDQRLAVDLTSAPDQAPGRMAPATAIAVLTIGVALARLDSRWRRGWLAPRLLVVPGSVACLALLGYVFGIDGFYRLLPFNSVALHTALSLAALVIGALAARPDRSVVALWRDNGPAGVIVRRTLPAVVMVPATVAGALLAGQCANWFGDEFHSAFLAVASSLALGGAIVWIARTVRDHETALHTLARSLDQRVRDRTAEIEAANRELEAFTYTVSHDLRTPLRHLDGFARLLEQREADRLDDVSAHYLDTIGDAARRMGALIDDLLALSRAGRESMRREPIDMAALCQEAWRELESYRRARQIAWRVGVLPGAVGDPTLVRMVWVNLLDNAIKYTQPRAQAQIWVEGGVDGGAAWFRVRDNGVGFDHRYAGKLFGVFQRLHRDDEFAGTGIGLATVRRIVERHGGRCWADLSVDDGAAFAFQLPVSAGR